MLSQEKFLQETERIRIEYARYDNDNLWQTIWSPFNDVEAGYRSQQLLAFADLMRKIGRDDLNEVRILDVGCGRGRILRSFLDMGAEPGNLFGVDLREESIKEAQRISPHLSFSTTNGITLDFSAASFDLVTQYVVFSSIGSQELRMQLAGEMWRVLKPGGYIFWWDMKHMASAAGGHSKALDASSHFRDIPMKEVSVGLRSKPGNCLRPLRGIGPIIGPLLNYLGYPDTHIAALIGPKS